jgi:hypothetical protein
MRKARENVRNDCVMQMTEPLIQMIDPFLPTVVYRKLWKEIPAPNGLNQKLPNTGTRLTTGLRNTGARRKNYSLMMIRFVPIICPSEYTFRKYMPEFSVSFSIVTVFDSG